MGRERRMLHQRWRSLAIGMAASVLVLVAVTFASATPMPDPVPRSAPDLVPTAADIRPSPAFEGDVLEVSVTLSNRGDVAAGFATVDLIDTRPDGELVAIGQTVLTVPVSPGSSVVVPTPRFLAVDIGPHTLTVRVGNVTPAESDPSNNMLTIPVTVGPAKAPPPPPPPSDGFRIEALVSIGIGALVGFVLILFIVAATVLLVTRRMPPSLEPPPPEPPDRSPPPIWPP